MYDKLLSINIDMGMKYNGVYYALLERQSEEQPYKLMEKSGVCINKGDIKYSKAPRRAKRQITATYQREKLAKRLFDEIIGIDSYIKEHQDLLHGLFKNRGFTYITIGEEFDEAEESVIEFIEQKAEENKNDILVNLYSIEDIELAITSNATSDENLKNYMENVIKEIENINKPYVEYLKIKDENKKNNIKDNNLKSPFDKEIYNYLKRLKKLFLEQKKEVELGQKPRATYFKDIKEIINTKINFVESFTKYELYNIVCNISNLQLRCLRKYFNNKPVKSQYNDTLLAEKLHRFYKSRHYKQNEKHLIEYLKPFLTKLIEDKKALDFLKTADPVYTIPSMEDMNNRYGYKCNVLVLKDEWLNNKNIQKCLEAIYKTGKFIDHNGEIIEDISYFIDKKTGYVDYDKAFRRFTDYSLDMIDKTKITPVGVGYISESSHPRKVFTESIINDEYFKSSYFKGLEKEYEIFRELLLNYYQEERNILNGIYTEQKSIFKPCGCNAPKKNKVKHILIKSLIRFKNDDFTENDVKEFEEKIRSSKYKGRSSIYNFLTKVSETAKDDKNSFFHNAVYYYNNSNEKNKKYDEFKNLEIVMQKLAEVLYNMGKIDKGEREELSIIKDEKSFKNKLNIAKQLYDILGKDISGFYKTCRKHTEENEQRSQVFTNIGHAVYKRPLSRVSKPIDGMLDMHLDRLAYEIVENIPFNISDVRSLEINVEENKFDFEEGLADIKGKPVKSKNKKDKEKLLCPYSGKEIVNGDYDHIIPRSSSLGIFNSEANLIYCSAEGNQAKKGKLRYNLSNIAKEHKKQVFGTTNDDEIIKYISENLNRINKDTYTNFSNLDIHQQNAFRYGLFLQEENNELFKKALELLKQDKLKTTTNGTQKRLISLIYEKLLIKNSNIECTANVVESKVVRAVRNDLSGSDNKLVKVERQNTHSHCIDASIVFYLTHSKAKSKSIQSKYTNNAKDISPEYDYFNDVFIEDSAICQIDKKRKFITLNKTIHDMGSVKYFDDTIYSIYIKPFKITDDKKAVKNLNILMEKNLLYKHINKGKKWFIKSLDEVNKNDYLWIDKQKYFDLLFSLFHNGNIEELEKLKFMDKFIGSKTKKEVRQIFFKDGDVKKEMLIFKDMPKSFAELYSRLKYGLKDIEEDKREEQYKKICETFFNPHNSKRLRKTRRIYSLEVEGQANYIIKRNKHTYQALRSKDIATPTYIIGDDIVNVEYYSKNAIPFKIEKLLNILKYKDMEKVHIYEISVKNIGNINKEAEKYIKELTYTFAESGRVRVKVALNKYAFNDIDFTKLNENSSYNIKDEAVAELVNGYINNNECIIYQFIGKPRPDGKQIKILKQTRENIILAYPKQIDKEFKKFIKSLYETHSN